jgi:processive 1,2-diacylglycerol beta-glucosyltransferase
MKTHNRIALGIVIILASIAMLFVLRNYMPLAKKFIKPAPPEKKKIVIFTSSGGRGHISATEAIQEYLGDAYEIKVVYPVREILQELDFIHKITGGSYNAEDMYNTFLARKQIGMVKTMVYAGQFFMTLQRRTMERLIDAYVESEAPDMIISVMPNVNGATYTVANKRKIPLWIIPTDFDLSGFLFHIYKPQSEQFFVNYPLADSMVINTTRQARLKPSQSTYVGMPVRTQFLKEYNVAAIKEKFGIQQGKPVIMVMMGGRGAKAIEKLAAQLVQLETPVHLLLCIGKQTEVKDAIAAFEPAPGVTLSIIEFTPHIAELMAISDLFVTKSGGQSVSEALYMGLPMLLDATDQALDWEQLNRKLVEKRGFGTLVKRLNKLVPTVKAILDNPAQLAEWKTNIQSLHLPNPCTGIRNQVTQLIGT